MDVWNIDESHFPSQGSLEEKTRFWLKYAILAPSAHNNQPWKVRLTDDGIDIYLDPQYIPHNGTQRQTMISIGAFIENFALAARHWGYEITVSDIPIKYTEKVCIAKVRLHPVDHTDEKLELLFSGITKRHTNRGLYDTQPLPDSVLQDISNLPGEPGVHLTLIQNNEAKQRISRLCRKGVYVALSLPPMKRELGEFVKFQRENSPTGMLVEAMVKNPAVASDGMDWTLHKMSAKDDSLNAEEKYREAPLLLLVSSEFDGQAAWVASGRLLQRLMNFAGAKGYTHCLCAAPIEIPVLSPFLRKETKNGTRPQVLLRIGIPQDPEFTLLSPRRSAETIIS